jgi:hypothetical protein
MEENRIPKRVLCMNLESTIPRGRSRNRWQVEVREDGRIVGGEEWAFRFLISCWLFLCFWTLSNTSSFLT